MTKELWTRIDELFNAALEREPGERAAFLAQACGGEAVLRHEVESLLVAHERAAGFLEGGAARLPEPAEPAEPVLAEGRRLGPYQVLALLGVGGMGQVYRARDTRLRREVAIKVVSRAAVREEHGRLEREARAAASLNQPNILAVHDVGEEDGIFFVVSELLEGETLRARLSRGPPLPAARCLEMAREIARGLSAAHDKGIVHRDVKPDNLFITSDGHIKILDFGLAKSVPAGPATMPGESSTTTPGMVVGTAGYLSPEQAQGEPVGPPSDLFSFGAVLYEMLSGRRAFGQGSAIDVLHATVREEAPPLPPEAPPALDGLVRRCLAKDPGARFASARELSSALEAIDLATGAMPAPAPLRMRSMAVLPFRDLGGEGKSEHLGLGLADAIITELSQLGSVLVRSTSAVLRYQHGAVDPQQAGRELAVDAVVEGSFQRWGARLRITVRVVSSTDGSPIWARRIDTSFNDVFRMQDEVSRSIARALELKLTFTDERRLLRRVHAASPPGAAYELYLRGRAHLLRESLADYRSAIEWFEKAAAADPGFAAAWAGAAEGYARIAFFIQEGTEDGASYQRALALCDQALALDPELPEGHYVRAFLAWSAPGGFDHALAIRETLTALAGRPGLDDAYHRLATILHHVGLFDEAIVEWERALAISPDHELARLMLAYGRHHQGHYREALEISEGVARRAPSSWIHYQVAQCQLRLGLFDEARGTVERMVQQLPGEVLAPPLLAMLAALAGDAAAVHQEVGFIAAGRNDLSYLHHAWYDAACAHALIGEPDEALRWLARAAQSGYPCHPFFAADPWLAPLREDHRFQHLIAGLREECGRYARLYAELRG